MYKTVQITCFTKVYKVFYVTAFGFVRRLFLVCFGKNLRCFFSFKHHLRHQRIDKGWISPARSLTTWAGPTSAPGDPGDPGASADLTSQVRVEVCLSFLIYIYMCVCDSLWVYDDMLYGAILCYIMIWYVKMSCVSYRSNIQYLLEASSEPMVKSQSPAFSKKKLPFKAISWVKIPIFSATKTHLLEKTQSFCRFLPPEFRNPLQNGACNTAGPTLL